MAATPTILVDILIFLIFVAGGMSFLGWRLVSRIGHTNRLIRGVKRLLLAIAIGYHLTGLSFLVLLQGKGDWVGIVWVVLRLSATIISVMGIASFCWYILNLGGPKNGNKSG